MVVLLLVVPPPVMPAKDGSGNRSMGRSILGSFRFFSAPRPNRSLFLSPTSDICSRICSVRAFTRSMTEPAFPLMPLASSFMKSGIYSSASDRGPSSGTEKCRRLLTRLATLCAAEITDPAAARTPAAIWEQISRPQLYADDAMLLRELKLLLMLDTAEDTVDFKFDIAEDTVDLT